MTVHDSIERTLVDIGGRIFFFFLFVFVLDADLIDTL